MSSIPPRDYQRLLVKVSGGYLATDQRTIDRARLDFVVEQLRPLHEEGLEISMVVGGGNVLRGAKEKSLGMNRSYLDSMGMLATVINGMALAEAFRGAGIASAPYSAIQMRHDNVRNWNLEEVRTFTAGGGIPIFVGGTGLPFFSTDTGGVVRALQMDADIMIKASRVDGVFNKDPELHADAELIPVLKYADALALNLQPLDQAAFALARENNLPIAVLNLGTPNVLERWYRGEDLGTLVCN
jgi:uridylate kinase